MEDRTVHFCPLLKHRSAGAMDGSLVQVQCRTYGCGRSQLMRPNMSKSFALSCALRWTRIAHRSGKELLALFSEALNHSRTGEDFQRLHSNWRDHTDRRCEN